MQQIQWRSVDVRSNRFKPQIQNTVSVFKTQNRKAIVFFRLQIFGLLCEYNRKVEQINHLRQAPRPRTRRTANRRLCGSSHRQDPIARESREIDL